MALERPKYIQFITPRLTLQWPKLNKPETKYKAEGEYTAKGAFDLKDLPKGLHEKLVDLRQAFFEFIKSDLEEKMAAAKAAKKGADAKKIKEAIDALKLTDKIFAPELDKESGDETGRVIINAKLLAVRKNKKTGVVTHPTPDIFDSKGTKLVKIPQIWGGTEAKLAVAAAGYYAAADGKIGVTFYLNGVQILKLVSSGSGRDAKGLGFAEEEGYDGSEEPVGFVAATAEGGGDDQQDF